MFIFVYILFADDFLSTYFCEKEDILLMREGLISNPIFCQKQIVLQL